MKMVNIVQETPVSPPVATAERGSEASAESPRAGDSPSPRAAILSIVGFWAFYFVMNTIRMAAVEAPGQLEMLPRRLAVSIFGAVLTGILCLLLRRLDGKPIRTLVSISFLASLPVSFGYSAINFAAFYVVHPAESELQELQKQMDQSKFSAWHVIVDSALNWYFFIVAWAVLYIAMSYACKVRLAERNAAKYRAEAQSAQLRALRYQINPHFLFNTLNSLSTLVMRRQGNEAEQMILNLSNFFRTSLTVDPTEDVSLIDEIRMQCLYLDIEQIRFPDRLRVVLNVPSELESAAVPGMILQPIVENAIKYGVARSVRPVTVTIRARSEHGRLNLIVEDDGTIQIGGAPSPEKLPGSGVGLRNVCDRLVARFGADADCRYGPRLEGGYRVSLSMPLNISIAGAA